MSAPAGYSGAKIEIVERDIKLDQTASYIERTLKMLPALKRVGIFQQDKDDGDLTQATKTQLVKSGASFVEMKDFVDTANTTKTASELKNLKTASEFAEWTFKKVIDEVESILENDKVTKHAAIQKKIESGLDDDKEMASFLKTHPGLNTSFLEYPIPVLIQSGSNFALNKF